MRVWGAHSEVGTLRKVLKRYGHWRRLQDHITMLSESEGPPIGRALTKVLTDEGMTVVPLVRRRSGSRKYECR